MVTKAGVAPIVSAGRTTLPAGVVGVITTGTGAGFVPFKVTTNDVAPAAVAFGVWQVNVAVRAALSAAAGVKRTGSALLAPAAMLSGKAGAGEKLNSAALAPPKAHEATFNAAVLAALACTVTGCVAVGVPAVMPVNVSAAGVAVYVIDAAAAAGHVMIDVKLGGLGPGVAVCAQVKVAVCEVACGTQVRPIAGALAPSVAGAAMLRVPPLATANDAVPAGIVQESASDAVPEPAVATVTGTVPDPAVSVADAPIVAVGAVFTGAGFVPFKVTTNDVAPAAVAFGVWQVNVAVRAALSAAAGVKRTGRAALAPAATDCGKVCAGEKLKSAALAPPKAQDATFSAPVLAALAATVTDCVAVGVPAVTPAKVNTAGVAV